MKRRYVTEDMKNEMRRLESEGMKRIKIAEALQVDQSTVTKALGAVRQYRGARMPAPVAIDE